jgi:hypothetical protein
MYSELAYCYTPHHSFLYLALLIKLTVNAASLMNFALSGWVFKFWCMVYE